MWAPENAGQTSLWTPGGTQSNAAQTEHFAVSGVGSMERLVGASQRLRASTLSAIHHWASCSIWRCVEPEEGDTSGKGQPGIVAHDHLCKSMKGQGSGDLLHLCSS